MSVESNLKKAQTLIASGDLAKARKACEKALKLAPQAGLGLFLMGVIELRSKRYPQSLAWFDKAQKVAPGVPEVPFNIGVANEALGKASDALTAYQQALSLKPGYVDAMSAMARVHAGMGDHTRAIEILDGALRLDARNLSVLLQLGSLHAETRDTRRAIGVFERGLKIEPGHPELARQASLAQAEVGAWSEAISILETAIRANPHTDESGPPSDLALLYADTLRKAERLDAAEELYRQYVGRGDPKRTAAIGLGLTLLDRNQAEDAIAVFETVLEGATDPEILSATHNNLGLTYQYRGDLPKAEASFREAIRLVPSYGEAYRHFAAVKKFAAADVDLAC